MRLKYELKRTGVQAASGNKSNDNIMTGFSNGGEK
jgi:hypothetical protein